MDKLTSFYDKYSDLMIATLAIIIITYILKMIVSRIFHNKIDGIRKRYLFRQTVSYVAYIIMLFSVIIIWFEWLTNFLTFLSLVTGAIIITSKEIVQNLFANIVIISRELFQVGDRIQIGDSIGDVIETGPLYVTLTELTTTANGEEPTGRIIKVPNNFVFAKILANYSKSLSVIWNEISIKLNNQIDINVVKSIMLKAANSFSFLFDDKSKQEIQSKHGDLIFIKTDPSVYITLEDKKIIFTLRYACKFYKKKETENQIYESIINQLKEHNLLESE